MDNTPYNLPLVTLYLLDERPSDTPSFSDIQRLIGAGLVEGDDPYRPTTLGRILLLTLGAPLGRAGSHRDMTQTSDLEEALEAIAECAQPQFSVRDEQGESRPIWASDVASARAKALAWLAGGDYDTSRGTVWVDGVLLDAQGEEIEELTATIDQDEPFCVGPVGTSHDWQAPHELVGGLAENPGVFGHGGGVTVQEACVRCGCGRLTDTWAQRPDTGEQGLRSVSYTADQFDVADLASGDADASEVSDAG